MPKVMKKNLFLPLLLLLMFSLFSCKKETETFDYNVNGINNLATNRGETKTITVDVSKTQGPPEEVTISLQGVPNGVTAAIETRQGLPDFTTPISFIISPSTDTGSYQVTLIATSASRVKTVIFNLKVTDQLSMVMAVYDGTQWTPELAVGEVAPGATINLYADEAGFLAKTPVYTALTDSTGRALLYHIIPGNYLFTIEKGNLSNIVEKTNIGGVLKGFVTTGIFQTKAEVLNSAQQNAQIGQLRYRDQNGDNKITDADREQYDMVMLYAGVVANKIIWIGN